VLLVALPAGYVVLIIIISLLQEFKVQSSNSNFFPAVLSTYRLITSLRG